MRCISSSQFSLQALLEFEDDVCKCVQVNVGLGINVCACMYNAYNPQYYVKIYFSNKIVIFSLLEDGTKFLSLSNFMSYLLHAKYYTFPPIFDSAYCVHQFLSPF